MKHIEIPETAYCDTFLVFRLDGVAQIGQCGAHIILAGGFQQESTDVHAVCLERVLGMGGNEDDVNALVACLELLRQFDAIHAGHFDIEKHHVEMGSGSLVQRLLR